MLKGLNGQARATDGNVKIYDTLPTAALSASGDKGIISAGLKPDTPDIAHEGIILMM